MNLLSNEPARACVPSRKQKLCEILQEDVISIQLSPSRDPSRGSQLGKLFSRLQDFADQSWREGGGLHLTCSLPASEGSRLELKVQEQNDSFLQIAIGTSVDMGGPRAW